MNKLRVFLIFAVALLLVAGSTTAWAAPPPSATMAVSVTPHVSSPLGIAPVPPAGDSASDIRFYNYSVTEGTILVDNIDVDVCITSVTASPGFSWSFTMEFAPDGAAGNLPGDGLSDTAVFSGTGATDTTAATGDGVGTCKTMTIHLDTVIGLSDISVGADYSKNILVKAINVPADHVNVNTSGNSHLKIRVFVEPAPALTCFVTDSDFNYLFLCDGTTQVTAGSDGRFTIVTNKKGIEVATNPGQFYYHVLWTNTTGSQQTVTVTFARNGVRPQGAQAIHAGLFPPPFSGVDLDGFNTVNDSIPSGSDDVLEGVVVPAGWTLWADYHLEWTGLGAPVAAGASNSCDAANQNWTVTATLSGGATGSCTAGAKGYLKK